MAKKNASIEETTFEENAVETLVVETKPSEGYPSRDFFTPIAGVANGRLTNGGQEKA